MTEQGDIRSYYESVERSLAETTLEKRGGEGSREGEERIGEGGGGGKGRRKARRRGEGRGGEGRAG